ncbi:fructose-bisphosphate aldolase, cytoplasmic [Musa troglodytarum]|uniref:fructose-bisphosphate aldolase n=1 Tax=Musa troglodytarum TaxID=320322 RepID=A0A9E7EU73_9LILI|nr:fructose-bisphosphate aldolase, cytoplasmic [Musa troglodytarum]
MCLWRRPGPYGMVTCLIGRAAYEGQVVSYLLVNPGYRDVIRVQAVSSLRAFRMLGSAVDLAVPDLHASDFNAPSFSSASSTREPIPIPRTRAHLASTLVYALSTLGTLLSHYGRISLFVVSVNATITSSISTGLLVPSWHRPICRPLKVISGGLARWGYASPGSFGDLPDSGDIPGGIEMPTEPSEHSSHLVKIASAISELECIDLEPLLSPFVRFLHIGRGRKGPELEMGELECGCVPSLPSPVSVRPTRTSGAVSFGTTSYLLCDPVYGCIALYSLKGIGSVQHSGLGMPHRVFMPWLKYAISHGIYFMDMMNAAYIGTPGKGILAADESTGTIGKCLTSINVEANHCALCELLVCTRGLEGRRWTRALLNLLAPMVTPPPKDTMTSASTAPSTTKQAFGSPKRVLAAFYNALNGHHVLLEGSLPKPNMVTPRLDAAKVAPEVVVEYTVRTLLRTVPAAVPVIVFLSGGQSEEEATLNLNAMIWLGGRSHALQQSTLKTSAGKEENMEKARAAFLSRCKAN